MTRAFWGWLARAVFAVVNGTVGFAAAALVLAMCGLGLMRGAAASAPVAIAALAAIGTLLLVRLLQRLHRGAGRRRRLRSDFELGSLFIATAFAVIEVAGGPTSLLYPLIYALIAFLVAYHAAGPAVYFLVLIFGTEAALTAMDGAQADWRLFASHASFNVLFALLTSIFLRAEVIERRLRADREVSSYLHNIAAQANEYRLTSGVSHLGSGLSGAEMAERRQIGSVHAIAQALYNILGVAERAVSPNTVALLWLDASDRFLRIKELRSSSDYITEKPIAAGEGVFGAVVKSHEPLVLTRLKPGHSGLVYYERPQPITDVLVVPVMDGRFLRGVLLADRTSGEPFVDSDIAAMTTIAAEIVRTVQVERVFFEMDRDKFQKERFYEASREFNQALNIKEVAQTALRAAKRVAQVDFAALAVTTEHDKNMRIEALDWIGHEQAAGWLGREFNAVHGLVGAALKAHRPLPHGPNRARSQPVFGEGIELDLPHLHVKVIPLVTRGRGVGALVLASDVEDFLPPSTLDMLKVIADHAAIALTNAQLYEHNERLATTDGLTGLVNHRQFQAVFDQMLAQAERYGRRLSVILTDIDHFKSINDTYGHPVGDKVLKRIAGVLSQTARAKIDLVARYGGEEFAILLPETDQAGAMRVAERIRTGVTAEQFSCENGRFRSSLSLGIATFPDDAVAKAKLVDCADQALYAAKRGGRNRSIAFDMLKPARREASQDA